MHPLQSDVSVRDVQQSQLKVARMNIQKSLLKKINFLFKFEVDNGSNKA